MKILNLITGNLIFNPSLSIPEISAFSIHVQGMVWNLVDFFAISCSNIWVFFVVKWRHFL